MDFESALTLEAAAQAGCMEGADFKEGYSAFVEKPRRTSTAHSN